MSSRARPHRSNSGRHVSIPIEFARVLSKSRTAACIRAIARLNGTRHTFYCGAHLRNGFHEDGVMSALAVTKAFGLGL